MGYKNTDVLVAAIQQGPLAKSFLRDRYFPKTELSEFATEDVLVEYKKNGQKCAPFVVPYIGGVAVEREGYTAKRYTPANIEPKITMSLDDLNKKGFGEGILANVSPAERANKLLAKDLLTLDEMTTKTEEFMAASVLLNNKIVMKHLTDDKSKPVECEIRFYDESSNPYTYTPDNYWNASGAAIIDDLVAICTLASKDGIRLTDLIVSPSALSAIRKNSEVKDLLDNKRIEYGDLNPQDLPGGATLVGRLNADGFMLNVISYNEYYTNDAGESVPYITDGYVVLATPAGGQRLYGAVTQMENDKEYHTYVGDRIPKIVADEGNDKREIKITTKPLLAPMDLGAFYSAKVINV